MLAGHLAARPQAPAEKPAGEPAASFEQPFKEDNPSFPLGSTPLLASEATLTASGEGLARLILREGRERSFTLNVNGELLQALCAMLRKSAEQAGWGLALDYAPAAAPAPAADNAKPGLLH